MGLDPIVERLAAGRLEMRVENQGRLVFATDRPGLKPLRDMVLDRPAVLDGADVALPAVGLGVAYLLIHAKVGRVFTRVMSHEAKAALTEEGIEFGSGSLVKKLPPDLAARLGTLDERARGALTVLAFIEELKRSR